jgi:glucose/arabinose dehydrogenase
MVFANADTVTTASVFLDISGAVRCCGEEGLIGLAFHPQYGSNGRFFVHYMTTVGGARHHRVSRFTVSADPDAADPASERTLLEFRDNAPNHNGGAMLFGSDGYLYIAIGDEGGGGDLFDNAQNLATLFGKILRIDVDQDADVAPYHGIPADNPFAGNTDGYREEIYAYGFRNPWRMSFDAPSGRLWAGDVGQDTFEEINVVEKGGNYGWDCREGTVPYDGGEHPSSPLCATAGPFIDPVRVYGRSEGISIVGGYVYRGPTLASLTGKYVYADYSTKHVWALAGPGGPNELLTTADFLITSFGVDESGELYICAYRNDGTPTGIYRLVETEVAP